MISAEMQSDFDFDRDGFQLALALLEEHFSATGEPLPHGVPFDLPTSLPDHGIGGHAALEALAPIALAGAARLRHPGFLAHMDPPTPWFTWASQLWAAALNQNLLHPETAPAARPLELRAIEWLAPFFGMTGGHLVPGSTIANLTALWAARELRGVEEVVASEAAHVSVRKAASILGLRYRAVPVDSCQRLCPDALEDVSRSAVVLTAGTVAAGAVDPVQAGATAAWRHVDAAWAGPLRLSPVHSGVLDGIETADSVAFSAHKWLFQPKECAAVLFADTVAAHEALAFGGGYLAVANVGLLGSHGASALPLVATLLAWGRAGTARCIERCMALAADLAQLVREREELELFTEPMTGVVVWRPLRADARRVRERLDGAFVSLTQLGGETWLRSVPANPMADPGLVVDRVLEAKRELGELRAPE